MRATKYTAIHVNYTPSRFAHVTLLHTFALAESFYVHKTFKDDAKT